MSRPKGRAMAEYDRNNIFARILRGELPCHKVYEDEHTLAFMDIAPRGDGHTLVIPKKPSRNVLDIEAADFVHVTHTVMRVARAAKMALNADGVTIQQFNESAGGQVVFHTHVHIIPRFAGVSLKPPASAMGKPEELAAIAAKIGSAIPR
jgi:histidine triad (HIT) family protein